MKRSLATFCLSGLALIGCDSEPRQWLVTVSTDAPVPQLGDHLLLEVLGAASCTANPGALDVSVPAKDTQCLRLIGIDGPESLPLSFGVVPLSEEGDVRVRARLYRAEQTGINGLPGSDALIDAVGRLPPLDGETRVAFELSASCFGIPSRLEEGKTCDPDSSELGPEPELPLLANDGALATPGSWPDAVSKPCSGPVPDSMVCVPGGVFILGNPRPGYVTRSDLQSLPEHLVKLAPFAMDVDEVTVGVVRGLLTQDKITSKPLVKSAASDDLQGACTYLGIANGANDALPVNCISRATAEEICTALEKRLPTEAEWEYATGNLQDETLYPWGDDSDLCAKTLIGVGRHPDEIKHVGGLPQFLEGDSCRPLDESLMWGPVPGGKPDDVTKLGIHNLVGSMAEWVADDFASYADPCWQPGAALLVNPVCTSSDPAGFAAYRGSNWGGFKLFARATARNEDKPSPSPYIGLRCVKSM